MSVARIPTNPDVVVIGAGTAGLSAAKALKAKGYSVLVLEAASFVGGRCYTDHTRFSVPFDVGGSWLHSAAINPLARIAEDQNVIFHKSDWDPRWVCRNNEIFNDEQLKEYTDASYAMWDVVSTKGASDPALSIADTLPEGRYKDLIKHHIAPYLGADAEICSANDLFQFAKADGDWLLEGGLGSFVERLHADIDVMLDCSVSKIDLNGPSVKIETVKGTLTARHVVLTVSTGVLAKEGIEFDPPLPKWKLDAIHQLPMGLLNKVGIEFTSEFREATQGDSISYHVGDDAFCSIDFGFYNSQLAISFVAGRCAAELEKDGPNAATAFSIDGLKKVFGNNITKQIKSTFETTWLNTPTTWGSYSYAKPGTTDARKVLAKTLADRLFFAGEATMPHAQATVHGAYLSGLEVADRISKSRS